MKPSRAFLMAAAVLAVSVACSAGEEASMESSDATTTLTKAAPGDKGVASVMEADATAGTKAAPQALVSELSFSGVPGAKGTQRLSIGSSVRGEITAEDGEGDAPAPLDIWVFDLPSAGEITLHVASAEINPMVFLLDGEYEEIESYFGDDGVLYILDLAAGTYQAAVTGVPSGLAEQQGFSADPPLGAYEISLDFRAASDGNHTAIYSILHAGMGSEARELALAFGVDFEASASLNSGELRDGSYFEDHLLELKAGQTVTVTMRSVQFDTFLLVIQDEEILASNDDAGTSTDSQITFTAPAAGTYAFRANSFEAGATGTYSLVIDR